MNEFAQDQNYRFGRFEMPAEARQLLRDGVPAALGTRGSGG